MPTLNKFYILTANASVEVIRKVGMYLFYGMKTRYAFMKL